MPPTQPQPDSAIRVALATLLAWLVPGAGHLLLGQIKRGIVLGLAIGLLWVLGLLIGGISVMSRGDSSEWILTLGHPMMAPSLVVRHFYHELASGTSASQDQPAFQPSLARVREQGTLFTSLAGFLNLLAIFDVVCHDPQRRREGNYPATGEGESS